MGKLKGKLYSGMLVLTLVFSLLSGSLESLFAVNDAETVSAAEDYGLADNIEDGVILHAWCWSFNTIKNNMRLIAESGYTSIQTSPINECVAGDNGALTFNEHWYYHYQPTNYTIGNYQLGTEAEFKAMCQEADKYGIKIIVDVVANHMTSDWSKINPSWQNYSYFHGNTLISNWNSRYDVTQNALLGLWDLNTQNTEVQQRILSYLKQCVADGADGFRYDAAKHVELPDDAGFGGNFWPVVLNNGADFQYGEILQDSISREDAYANYMNVTASSYGYVIREQLAAGNLSAARLSQYYAGNIDSDNLVTWVESHDNYCDGVSTYMTDNDIRLAWAVLAAREKGTPLYFSRPQGGGNGVKFPEQSRIGDIGDDLFYDKTIVEVNKFHNAMVGESETMKNYNGNSCVVVERGAKGMVIVNIGGTQDIYMQTALENGTYTDQVGNGTFTVSNGYISGRISSNSVHVLYKTETGPSVLLSQNGGSFSGTLSLTMTLKNAVSGTYKIGNEAAVSFTGSKTVLIGADMAVGDSKTVTVTAAGGSKEYSRSYTFTKGPDCLTVHFKRTDWEGGTPYIYAYTSAGTTITNSWPGTYMTADSSQGNGWYTYTNQLYTAANVMFTMGASSSNRDPGDGEPGYAAAGEVWYYEGAWYTYNPENIIGPETYTVTFMDGNKIISAVECDENNLPKLADALSCDGKLFAGWFTRPVSLKDASEVKSALAYTAGNSAISEDTVFYAGWIETGDGNDIFELAGTQVRIKEPSGLRFVTKIGTNLISSIEALNSSNISLKPDTIEDKGIGFGTVVTRASNLGSYELVKDINASAVISGRVVVPAAALFDINDEYLMYTAVVCNIPVSYYNTEIAARPYITYADANGVEQTYYYTETASSSGGGYSVSLYQAAKACCEESSLDEKTKEWLKTNILDKTTEAGKW